MGNKVSRVNVDDFISRDVVNRKVLDLSSKNLTTFPTKILWHRDLQLLDLSRNPRLQKIPRDIAKLDNLIMLSLEECGLSQFPYNITQLHALEELFLGKNNLRDQIPQEILNIQRLAVLWLNACGLTKFPLIVCQLDLYCLYLGENNLKHLPKDLGYLQRLQVLGLERCNLRKFPSTLFQLPNLEKLYLTGNRLCNIPKYIAELRHLSILRIRLCFLGSFPEAVCGLLELEELDVSDNHLVAIPETICNLTKLTILQAENGCIETFPEFMADMKELKELDLRQNNLNHAIVPMSIMHITRVETDPHRPCGYGHSHGFISPQGATGDEFSDVYSESGASYAESRGHYGGGPRHPEDETYDKKIHTDKRPGPVDQGPSRPSSHLPRAPQGDPVVVEPEEDTRVPKLDPTYYDSNKDPPLERHPKNYPDKEDYLEKEIPKDYPQAELYPTYPDKEDYLEEDFPRHGDENRHSNHEDRVVDRNGNRPPGRRESDRERYERDSYHDNKRDSYHDNKRDGYRDYKRESSREDRPHHHSRERYQEY